MRSWQDLFGRIGRCQYFLQCVKRIEEPGRPLDQRDGESPKYRETPTHVMLGSPIPLEAGLQAAGNALAMKFQMAGHEWGAKRGTLIPTGLPLKRVDLHGIGFTTHIVFRQPVTVWRRQRHFTTRVYMKITLKIDIS